MRNLLMILCVLIAMTPALPSGFADEQTTGQYVLPSHGTAVCPTGVTNAPPLCVGGAIVKSPSGRDYSMASATVVDDVFGENVAFAICVGDDENLQGCTPGPIVCGVGAVATDDTQHPHSHVNVFILSIYVPENGAEPCFGVAGTVDVTFIE